MTEAAETVLEVFIPGPGENPEDPQDMERSEFLGGRAGGAGFGRGH